MENAKTITVTIILILTIIFGFNINKIVKNFPVLADLIGLESIELPSEKNINSDQIKKNDQIKINNSPTLTPKKYPPAL